MASGAQSKQKARQSRKKEGYYKQQFFRTEKNKASRAKRIARRKASNPNLKRAKPAAA